MPLKHICTIDCATELRQMSVLLSPKKVLTFAISEKVKTDKGIISKPLGAVQLDADALFELDNYLIKCLPQVVSTSLQAQKMGDLRYPVRVNDLAHWKETAPERCTNAAERAHLSRFLQNLIETSSEKELINLIEILYQHLPDNKIYRNILVQQLTLASNQIGETYLLKKMEKDDAPEQKYFWGAPEQPANVIDINQFIPGESD